MNQREKKQLQKIRKMMSTFKQEKEIAEALGITRSGLRSRVYSLTRKEARDNLIK